MAREMIGERRDGLGVKVERMQFLRNDAVDSSQRWVRDGAEIAFGGLGLVPKFR